MTLSAPDPDAVPVLPAEHAFLAGGGEMGARMRTHDWAATPLGPVASWPQALRTTVRLMLNTGHPMYLFWGPDLAGLYNDAYARTLGPERHPDSMGRPGREVWAEIWDVIGPQIEQVMLGRGATWHENQLVPVTRHGRREDVWWTYSYGPVDDDASPGGVGGVLVVTNETTATVLAQRHQALMLELDGALRALPDPEDRKHAACALLGRHLGVAQVGFGEVDADTETLTVARDWNDGRIPSVAGTWRMNDFGPPFIAEMRAGRSVAIRDVTLDPRTDAPAVVAAYESIRTRSILDVPLLAHGRMQAMLFIHHPEPRDWSAHEVALVEDACTRLWGAVGEARVQRERERVLAAERTARVRTERMQAYASVLAGARTRAEVARAAVEWGCRLIGCERGSLFLLDADTVAEPALVLAHAVGFTPDMLDTLRRLPWAPGTPGSEAVLRRVPVFVESREALLERYPALARTVDALGLRAVVAHPLVAGERDLGFLAFHFKEDRVLDGDERGFVTALSQLASQALDRALAVEALTDSEARFRVLTDTMPQIVWSTRPDGFHDYFNERWYVYTGMPRPHEPGGEHDGSGQGWSWATALHPDDQPATFAAWSHSLATGDPYHAEYRFRRHDGTWRWFIGRALAQRDEAGRIVRWFGTLTDIDDVRRVADERDALIARLTETDRRKDEFLAMLGHELRNPLAPLTNALHLLTRTEALGERGRRALEMAARQAVQLKHLVDDLLEVGRINQGKIELKPVRLSATAAVREALEAIAPECASRRHTLACTLPDGPLWIEADPVRLAQMLGNLLANACKYTPPGGTVGVTATRCGTEVEIRVTDSGIGIAPEKISGLFELFHQVDPALDRSQGGLGIGLALVRQLARMHGGSVHAESPGLGQGSSFVLRLPEATD